MSSITMKQYLFARPYFISQTQTKQEKISITTNYKLNHYRSYFYLYDHCSTTPCELKPNPQNGSNNYHENLVRARRCTLFADASLLRPVCRQHTKTGDSMIISLHNLCNLDHTTVWKSQLDTTLILTEPYTQLETHPNSLSAMGYSYIVIPTSISPYCGTWNPDIGALPQTKSYLICRSTKEDELFHIRQLIHAESRNLPLWNDTIGIQYA